MQVEFACLLMGDFQASDQIISYHRGPSGAANLSYVCLHFKGPALLQSEAVLGGIFSLPIPPSAVFSF